MMPSSGTFRGIYHKNYAGVGEFGYFMVHKQLLEKLAPYDGKYIELEVLKARQPINPGTSVIQEIGAVSFMESRNVDSVAPQPKKYFFFAQLFAGELFTSSNGEDARLESCRILHDIRHVPPSPSIPERMR